MVPGNYYMKRIPLLTGSCNNLTLNDNSPELQTIVHRLARCRATILK